MINALQAMESATTDSLDQVLGDDTTGTLGSMLGLLDPGHAAPRPRRRRLIRPSHTGLGTASTEPVAADGHRDPVDPHDDGTSRIAHRESMVDS